MGHFLEAFADYAPQLFDVDADPEELKDVSGDAANAAVLSELEAILANEFNYEYVDCVAKFNDCATTNRRSKRGCAGRTRALMTAIGRPSSIGGSKCSMSPMRRVSSTHS